MDTRSTEPRLPLAREPDADSTKSLLQVSPERPTEVTAPDSDGCAIRRFEGEMYALSDGRVDR